MPKPAIKAFSLKMRSKLSSSSFTCSSLDLTVATSFGLILQICLYGPIIVLQVLQVHLGQWPSFTAGMKHGTPHARAVYMATGLVREVAGCENCSRNHVTQVAEGLSYHLQLIRSDLDFTLWSTVNRAGISHAPCTLFIRIWCQSL